MKKTIILKSIKQLNNAIAVLKEVTFDPIHEVIIRPSKASITVRQRSLWFLWMGEIADYHGEDKADMHRQYKKKYLIDIYRRDDTEFGMMLEAINQVYREGRRTDGDKLRDYVLAKTSIMDASKAQMSELLQTVEVEATMKGVVLTNPADCGLGDRYL